MWVIGVLLLMSSMVGLKMVQFEVNAKPIGRQASTPVLAQNMVVYKSAVDVFVAVAVAVRVGLDVGVEVEVAT